MSRMAGALTTGQLGFAIELPTSRTALPGLATLEEIRHTHDKVILVVRRPGATEARILTMPPRTPVLVHTPGAVTRG